MPQDREGSKESPPSPCRSSGNPIDQERLIDPEPGSTRCSGHYKLSDGGRLRGRSRRTGSSTSGGATESPSTDTTLPFKYNEAASKAGTARSGPMPSNRRKIRYEEAEIVGYAPIRLGIPLIGPLRPWLRGPGGHPPQDRLRDHLHEPVLDAGHPGGLVPDTLRPGLSSSAAGSSARSWRSRTSPRTCTRATSTTGRTSTGTTSWATWRP